MKFRKICIWYFISIFSLLQASAQSEKFYSTDRDISNSLINALYQDRKGFIWIATEDGLNKFDGNKFTVYKSADEDSASLKNNYVRSLYEDRKNRFWIGCVNGLLRYNRSQDNFQEVDVWSGKNKIHPQVICFLERQNGDLWMATSGEGLLVIRKNSDHCQVDEEMSERLCSPFLTWLYEDSRGRIWVASDSKGLNLYLPEKNEIRLFKNPGDFSSNDITNICEDQTGTIFVATLSGGLYKYDEQKGSFHPVPYQDPYTVLRIKTLSHSHDGNLYIGTDGQGLKRYNFKTEKIEDFEISSGQFNFAKAKVHAVLEDQAGNLWVGIFQKGVFLQPGTPHHFKYFGYRSLYQNNIGSNCVMSIFKDSEGIVWVGTDNDGLYGIYPSGNQVKHYPLNRYAKSASNTIMSILRTSDNSLWLGSYLNGLERFNPQTGKSTYAKEIFPAEKEIPDDKVICLSEDNDKNLYVGTYGYGLFSMNLKTGLLTHHPCATDDRDKRPNQLPSRWINCIICDHEGLIWIGTYNGVCCYNPRLQSYKVWSAENGLPGNIVYTLLEDAQKQLWLGTTEGLVSFDKKTGRFLHYTVKDGLPNNVICSMFEDSKQHIWLSTHYGISKFNPVEKKFTNYYSFDGLQSNEFYRAAGFQAPDGEIYFGGIKGITYFHPEEIIDRPKTLTPYITDFYVFEKSIHQGDLSGKYEIVDTTVMDAKQFTLTYQDNAFSLEFSVLDFSNPERILYEYQLEGLNPNWTTTPPGMSRISFTNLNPGRYTLNFRAKDNDYVSPTRQVSIWITPPWYQTSGAYILWGFLTVLLIYGISFFIYSRIRHRQEMMKREHAEQINEAKLQFFINISHEIRTPMTLIINPLEKLLSEDREPGHQKTLQMIYRNAQRILRLINQLMDIRKIDKGQLMMKCRETDMVGFINDLMEHFSYQANKKNIQFKFIHREDHLKVWVDLNNFDKVVFNILSNAFKYTPDNGEISVELTTGNNENFRGALKHYFEITVTDSGIGIDQDKIEKIFERFYQINNDITHSNFGTGIGLHLSRSLVELHHGTLTAENRADAPGSRFIIRLPLGSAHLKAEELENPEHLIPYSSHLQDKGLFLPTENTNAPGNHKPKPKTKKHVLIVEDEEDILQYVGEELQEDYYISSAHNGKEGLEKALQEKPDLIISDVMMPEMDGITLCRKVKQNVNINHIPVVLLTAKSKPEDKMEGLEIGADAYLVKPFNTELLKSTISNLIENRERLKHKFSGQQQQEDKIRAIELKSADEILLEKVMKTINARLSDPALNVEMLAQEVGLSRVHLHRKLKELTNQPARDLIKSIRLKQAANLLVSKKLGISEVAYTVGFSNLSHFSNSFRDFYGLSPKDYVAQNKKQE